MSIHLLLDTKIADDRLYEDWRFDLVFAVTLKG